MWFINQYILSSKNDHCNPYPDLESCHALLIARESSINQSTTWTSTKDKNWDYPPAYFLEIKKKKTMMTTGLTWRRRCTTPHGSQLRADFLSSLLKDVNEVLSKSCIGSCEESVCCSLGPSTSSSSNSMDIILEWSRKVIVDNKFDILHVCNKFTTNYNKMRLETIQKWNFKDKMFLCIFQKLSNSNISDLASRINRLFSYPKSIYFKRLVTNHRNTMQRTPQRICRKKN